MEKSYRYYATLVGLFTCLAGVVSCTSPLLDRSNVKEIVKSDNDQRQYKFIELSNKLRVLLISDISTDKAAAALDINIGSRQDPQAYQGLAHFLEHMLFLGTKKYPEAGEYQEFINSHNGSHNAYTSFEHTNYFFDIDPVHLEQALDRFSQFFIAPLFTPEYVEREKNAVHSEYMAKIKSDQRKSLDVFKSVINSEHPFAKFSVGNLDTLSTSAQQGRVLQDELKKFYTTHYSANVMTLVVLGQQTLQELELMVSEKFSAIANSEKRIDAIAEPLFTSGVLPLSISIKPEKEQRVLSLSFPTEEQTRYFQQKPLQYIGNIIGHEGQGSLLSYLKEQGLAETLSAGSGLSYKGGGNFSIVIELTEQGITQTDEIIRAVFQTINRIKQVGAQRWLFNEQRSLAIQQFRYLAESAPINYVSSVASSLHYYPAPQVLSAPYLMETFDKQLINRFLNYLAPDNSVITLSAPNVVTDSKSHFYGTQYQSVPISPQTLKQWNNAGLNPQITLPKANEFIAENLALKTSEHTADVPELLARSDAMQLWFKHDDRFEVPKGSIFFTVRSPKANDTVKHSVLLDMYTRLVSDALNELSYPAMLAGLNYSITAHGRGFSVKITGFDDKQPLLLNKILSAITAKQFNSQRFNNIKQEYIRHLENSQKRQPYKSLMRQLSELLYKNKWSEKQLLSVYRTISVEQLQSYTNELLSEVDIQVLVYGNYLKQQGKQFGDTISQALLKTPVTIPGVDIVRLPQTQQSYPIVSDYSDSALVFYLQASAIDKHSRAAMGVVAHWLRSDFYTQLRTEKQLGYIVMAGAYPVIDIPGMVFMVQSPVAGHGVLQKEIQQFIKQKLKELETLPESVFDQHRRALIHRLSESAQNMWKQSGRYWLDITQGYTQFDSRKQLIRALQELTFSQWKLFYQEHMAVPKQRGVWLYSSGQFTDQVLLNTKKIHDIEKFKVKSDYYHVP